MPILRIREKLLLKGIKKFGKAMDKMQKAKKRLRKNFFKKHIKAIISHW